MKTVTIYCPEGVTCTVINAEPPVEPPIEPPVEPPVAGWATLPNLTLNAGTSIALGQYYTGTQTGYAATKPLPAGVTLAPATGILTAATDVANATLAGLAFTVGAPAPVEPPIEPPVEPGGDWVLDEATMTSLAWKPGKPWLNHWGSWKDKTGAICGYTPWDTAPIGMVDWGQPQMKIVFTNMVALVKEWIANGNRGALVRGGSARLTSHRHADPAVHPYMTINGIKCACTRDGYLDGGSDYPQNFHDWIGLYDGEGDIEKGVFQFDLTAVAGQTINSASMTIFSPKTEVVNSTTVHLLWPPA